jgi:diguanylate cyclase (GGDEF)-like protein
MAFKMTKPPRILVIDDSLTIRELIADYLGDTGYIVETADSGEDGWDRVCKTPPDLIISDWSMVGLSGVDLCQRIRKDPALEHIYFLLLTAREDRTDLVLGLDAGADEFISKPIHREELRARVRAGLRLRHLTQSLMEVNQQLHAQNELLASMSLIDFLTGVLNRRALETALPGLLQQVGDRQTEFFQDSQYILYYRYMSLWMIEVDRFASLVKDYGPQISDQIIQIVARRLQINSLPGTLLYRYAEQQFVCVKLGLEPNRSREFAESLKMIIGNHPIKLPSGQLISVTITLGGLVMTSERKMNWKAILENAEEALVQAKLTGTNHAHLLEEIFH